MSAEERIERVQDALQHRFRLAGYGSITRVQKALGLGEGYFKDQRRPGRRRVDLKILFRALEELEVDPSEFFAQALGAPDVVASFKSQALALERRMRSRPKILLLCPKTSTGLADAPPASGVAQGRRQLDELDTLRLENPKLVTRRAARMARDLEPRLLPRLLGIYASACRLLGHLDRAQVVLARALTLAEGYDDRHVLGDLLQRASYVVAHRGELELALALSEQATLAFVNVGDRVGIGKTLVDRGDWLAYSGRQREALRSFRSALDDYLPAEDERPDVRRNRFCCWMNLGTAHLELGEFEEARHFARRAREESQGIGAGLLGKLVWLQASIAERQGRLEKAEDHLRTALDVYRSLSPLEAAVVAVELVRLQLLQGKTQEVYVTAKSMTLLLQPLRGNPVASAAIMRLLRTALAGRGLTLNLVEKVGETLRQDKAPPARALEDG